MKRLSDYMTPNCSENKTPMKQHISSTNLSNRKSFNESIIMDQDQTFQDYDYVCDTILRLKRSKMNNNLLTSNILTSTNRTWISLADYLHTHGDGIPFPDWMTAMIIRDVATALNQLHRSQIAHGAVTFENIYFMEGEPRIGLLTNWRIARKMRSDTITETRSEDISQLGHVFFRCLTGQYPILSQTGDVERPACPFLINPEAFSLVERMMARKFPFSANFIIDHPYIEEFEKQKTAKFLRLF